MLRSFIFLMMFIVAMPAFAQNNCEYANDNECDEARFGGLGFCDAGTDSSDCALLIAGITDNSCASANDGTCNEPRYATDGSCQDGSDTNDCVVWQAQRESDFMERARALGLPADLTASLGDNTCRWSNDAECDDIEFGGTGYCPSGTDATDCLAIASQGVPAPAPAATPVPTATGDSCVFANDNECDEARYGGIGACEAGTDTTDCTANLTTAADGNNSCEYANDYECDETRYGGGGYCNDGTDTSDCRQLATGIDDNSCQYANDGECDERRYGGGGECLGGTDRTDCELYGTQPAALQTLIDLIPDNIEAVLGDDSCEYANDGECDDANFGGVAYCDAGTDATDCRLWAAGEDSCQYANDGECDEPGIGGGYCDAGTDVTDCAESVVLRNRTDVCNTAFDGICNEPHMGDGTCDFGSDTADCMGRGRPPQHPNHYFGRDDRVLVDTTQMPWAAVGALQTEDGSGFCTGTLVAPRLVLTAAHCLYSQEGDFQLPHSFAAGASYGVNNGTGQVVGGFHAEGYDNNEPDDPLGGGNGHDWAVLELDRDLGQDVGMVPVRELTAKDLSQIGRSGLIVSQAGYSWDTGDNLSGHMGCRVTEAFEDSSFLHVCDTAYGDSGSPFLLQIEGQWHVIGVDSRFIGDDDAKGTFSRQANLGVDSRAFAGAVSGN